MRDSNPDYECMVQDFYEQILREGDCCVDVGAHTGRHAIPMAQCVGARGCVHAFEPLPHAAEDLRKKVSHLDAKVYGAVTVHQTALAEQTGSSTFVSVVDAPEYSGLRRRIYDAPRTTEEIVVEVNRLDDYASRIANVAFMKIDVEGGELDVLRGAQGILDHDQPVIAFEFGDNSIVEYPFTGEDMFAFLVDIGYSVMTITRQLLDGPAFVDSARRQALWDYVAFPSSKYGLLAGWVSHDEQGRGVVRSGWKLLSNVQDQLRRRA